MKFDSYREKVLRHIAMVARFLDDNKPIKPLKSLLPNDYNFKGQNNKNNFYGFTKLIKRPRMQI